MFWIFGINSTLISTKIALTKCPNCTELGTIKISIYQWYFKLVFIPTIPLHKKSFLTCINCKNDFPIKKLSDELLWEYKEAKNKAKAPWWTFIGLFLFILIMPYIIHLSNINNQNKLMYIENPRVGDVYRIEYRKEEYSYCRIVEISNDTVFFSFNSFKSKKLIEFSEKDKVLESNYSKEKVPITKEELKKYLKNKDVFSITRNL